jgi:protein-arginine kinase
MKNLHYNNDMVAFIKVHDKKEVLIWVKSQVHVYHDELTPDMLEALASIDDYLESKLSVSQARKIAFLIHQKARESTDLKTTYLYRAIGHAIATIHVKEHAIRCYDYLIKFNKVNGGI